MEQDLGTVSNLFTQAQDTLLSPEPTAVEQPVMEPVPEAPTYTSNIANLVSANKALLEEAGITGHRMTHFMAQMAHESGGFRYMEEIDPSLSNLGNKGGEAYKGRGIIQLTGINNYRYYGQRLGLDLENNPELAADPVNSLKIAIEYWKQNKLNDYADRGDIRGITRIINGPAFTQRSLASRQDWFNRASAVQSDDAAIVADALSAQVGKPTKAVKAAPTMFDSDREEERTMSSSKVYRRESEGWFPSVAATYERASLSQAEGIRDVTRTKADDAFKQIEELTKIAPPSKGYVEAASDWLGFTPPEVEQAQEKKRFNEYIAQVRAQAPDIALPYQSYEDVAFAAMSEITSRKEVADQDIATMYEQGGFASDVGTTVGSLVGGMGGFLSDSENAKLALATAVVTGGASLGGQIAANVAVNVGQEAYADVQARGLEESIGIERTPEETVQNLVSAAAVGAALPIVGKGLKAAYQAFKGTPAGDMAAKALNEVIENETGISPDMSPFGDSPTGNMKLDAVINNELMESAKTGLPPAPVPDTVVGVKTPEVEVKLTEHDDLLRAVAETPEEKQVVEELIAARREAVDKAPAVTQEEYQAQLKELTTDKKAEFKQILDSNHKDVVEARIATSELDKQVKLNTSDLKAKDVYLKDLNAQLDTISKEASELNLRYNSFADKTTTEAALAKEQLKVLGEKYGSVEESIRAVDDVNTYLSDSITSIKDAMDPIRKDIEINQKTIATTETDIAALDVELNKITDVNDARYGALKAQQDDMKLGLSASKKALTESEKLLKSQEQRVTKLETQMEVLNETTAKDLAKFEKVLSKADEATFKAELEVRKEKLQRVLADHKQALESMSKDGENTIIEWEDANGMTKQGTVAEYRVDIESDQRALDLIVGCATGIGA